MESGAFWGFGVADGVRCPAFFAGLVVVVLVAHCTIAELERAGCLIRCLHESRGVWC